MRLYRKFRRALLVTLIVLNGLRSLWLELRVNLNKRRAARLAARQKRVDARGFELEARLRRWE